MGSHPVRAAELCFPNPLRSLAVASESQHSVRPSVQRNHQHSALRESASLRPRLRVLCAAGAASHRGNCRNRSRIDRDGGRKAGISVVLPGAEHVHGEGVFEPIAGRRGEEGALFGRSQRGELSSVELFARTHRDMQLDAPFLPESAAVHSVPLRAVVPVSLGASSLPGRPRERRDQQPGLQELV